MLAAEGLVMAVGRKTLLHRLDAVFQPGRITAIVGPNGAGKSTLLACLAGLLRPSGGGTTLGGVSVARLGAAERARRIGYLPQDAQISWNITVRALVALGRFPHRRGLIDDSAADSRAIARALDDVDLGSFAERLVGTLSGGERARALLARVLAGQPRWILADEPMAALDIAHRFTLMSRFRTVAGRGVGVVVVLHDLALAARMADDALLLDHGRMVALGPVWDVLTPPRLGPVFGVDFAYGEAADGAPTLVSAPRFP